jgi:HYDIN/CFA65/VesB-like, Ig-like domain
MSGLSRIAITSDNWFSACDKPRLQGEGHMTQRQFARILISSVVVALALTRSVDAQVSLINMVPQTRSGETNQDAEPAITINPSNPLQLAGTAFTWDNLTGAPMTGSTAPIYVSTDGGQTWSLVFNVPSTAGATFPTGDITVSFSGTTVGTTNTLYTGILHAPDFSMRVLRAADYRVGTTMTQLDTRTNNVDQPHVKAGGVGQDRLYVGFNNGFGGVASQTATLDFSQSAGIAAPVFNLNLLEVRSTGTGGQDGFAITPAVHSDGTVYAAFFGWRSGSTMDIVVMRDDNWGLGATPFRALVDSGDAQAGQRIVTGVTIPTGNIGQQRVGSSSLAIAVDPNNSSRVYVTWLDLAGTTPTLHVRRSTDRGQTWSSSDMVTVSNALNPSVAINSVGKVGFLYQQLTGTSPNQRWETHFVRTTDADATAWDSPGQLLANTPASTPGVTFSPYIGDYDHVVALDRNFYGIFSASNVPDTANFLAGVKYQRFANWTTHQLFADAAHTTVVNASIDPFFFVVNEVTPPEIQVPASITFPLICGGSAQATSNICNTGTSPLIITGISSSNPQFSVAPPTSGFPVTIAPGSCLPIQVTFTPSGPGPQSGTLTVSSNDPVHPTVNIAASGTAGSATIATIVADTGSFGSLCPNPNRFRDLPLTINNSGTCPLTITGITSSSGEFELPQVQSFPVSVAPGDSVAIPIRFHPTSAGAKTATLTVASNDPVTPNKSVAVSGFAPPPFVCQPPFFAAIDTAVGPTFGTGRTGNYTYNGSGHVLASFGPQRTFAIQAGGEYMFYPGRQEGQFDAGLLYRRNILQFGFSASLKDANLRSEASTGALSDATLSLDVLLPSVRFGAFFAKGMRETSVVTLSEAVSGGVPPLHITANERVLHTVDQLGGTVQFEIVPATWLDANAAFLNRHAPGASNTASAAVRLSRQLLPGIVGMVQLDLNESFIGSNTVGTVTFGVTLGRWSRPSDYSNPVNPLGTLIPRLRWEVFDRTR